MKLEKQGLGGNSALGLRCSSNAVSLQRETVRAVFSNLDGMLCFIHLCSSVTQHTLLSQRSFEFLFKDRRTSLQALSSCV